MRFPALHDVETRRRELKEKIAEGERAKKDLAQLDEWVNAGNALFSLAQSPAAPAVVSGTGPKFRRAGKSNPLASYAEGVLRRRGKLHINLLMEQMRQNGWISTGDNRRDMKNVNSSLSANKRFVNLGRNVWNLAEAEQSKHV